MYFTSEENIGKLYGTIWSGDGQWIANDLQAFLKGKSEATIHLHTPGGSVFDGNLIYNVLKASKTKVNIVIDGLAASMGSILMLAGSTVTMAENSFVMIHAPSGVVEGSANDMKNAATLLASLENQFVKKYVAKTGKTEQEVKQWLNGDNWFSADDAVSAGLVDGITNAVLEGVDLSAVLKMDTKALSDNFDKQFLNQVVNNKNNDTMKLNAQSKAVLGVSDDATDEQVNAAIEALSKDNQTMKARAE
ncbi:MAG TPA: ATP-dependent Clp protease proteolytic subunit, partial [Crocinitomicaceae bacterium]|nr:ATP-dependent Clp protease proteolytic subunit [Crocinitomicaceae bacterium]